MSMHSVHEMYLAPDEEAVARYWWSLPRGSILPLTNGETYQLLFAGRPGGAAGPDVRAAVLTSITPRQPFLEQSMRKILHARKYSGDVEFHVRVTDWFSHQHHSDARYNNVVLHVVLFCNTLAPTIRQDGMTVPVCSLTDLPARITAPALHDETSWPCQRGLQPGGHETRNTLLEDAGVLRFEQKMHAFIEQLHRTRPAATNVHSIYDLCLFPALAEGLGYGRNREFFRAIGLRLAGQETSVPEPLGHTLTPSPLDAGRLQSLRLLVERYRSGLWVVLHELLRRDESDYQTLRTLRALFRDIGLSLARADILVINIILPFASAVALLERDQMLNERALQLYKMHPGLSSNWITRMMTEQLHLSSEPHGSCRQQGLHYIYQQTCREKCCDVCIMGRETNIL